MSGLTSKNTILTNQQLSLLEEEREKVHSIVLIGSTIQGLAEQGSDIDIVVLCKERHYEEVSHALHGWETGEEHKIQCTIYKPSHVERIFLIGSPFANSIRNGMVWEDDGYLGGLLEKKE